MPVVITIYVNSAVKTAHELRYLRQKCTVKYLIKMVVKIQLQATKLHSTGFSLINVQFVLGKWLKLRREIHYEIVVRLINARIQCTANYTGPSVNMCSALTTCSTAERVSQSAKKIQKRIKKRELLEERKRSGKHIRLLFPSRVFHSCIYYLSTSTGSANNLATCKLLAM